MSVRIGVIGCGWWSTRAHLPALAAHPDAVIALRFADDVQLLVATMLSAQTTDVTVNRVTASLFEKYRRPEDYLAVPQEELEEDVRPTGFFRSKAKHIRGACRRILDAYGGAVPDTMEDLLTLPGVARKTANVVLGNSFAKAEGIAVDTHVIRLSGRLGLSLHVDPVKIEADLMGLFPREHWTNVTHLVILHGRRHSSVPAQNARSSDAESGRLHDSSGSNVQRALNGETSRSAPALRRQLRRIFAADDSDANFPGRAQERSGPGHGHSAGGAVLPPDETSEG